MTEGTPRETPVLHDSYVEDLSLRNSLEIPLSTEARDQRYEQFDRIYKIFTKSKEDREEEDVDFVKGILKTLPFFSEMKRDDIDSDEFLQHVYTAMNFKSFRRNEAVFHYGERGTNFYIILKGYVDVYIPKEPEELAKGVKQKVESNLKSAPRISIPQRRRGTVHTNSSRVSIGNIDPDRRTSLFLDPRIIEKFGEGSSPIMRNSSLMKNFKSMQKIVKEKSYVLENFAEHHDLYMKNGIPKFKKVKTLMSGELFGENALAADTRRDATMIASTNLHVIMISKASFNSIFECLEKNLKMKWDFFAKLTGQTSKEAVLKFCYGFKERSYRYNQPIFSQGQLPSEIYVIREGEIQISRHDAQDEDQSVVQRLRKTKKNIIEKKIVNVGPPHFFGEGEALLGQPYEYTAKSLSSDTVLYVLSIQEFQILKQEYPAVWEDVHEKYQTKMPHWKSRNSHVSKIRERLEEEQIALKRTFSNNSASSRDESNNSINSPALATEDSQSQHSLLNRRKSKFNLNLKASPSKEVSVTSEYYKNNSIETPQLSDRQNSSRTLLNDLDSPRVETEAKPTPSPLRRDSRGPFFGGRHITEIVESKFKLLKRQSVQAEASDTAATCPTEFEDTIISPTSSPISPKKKTSSPIPAQTSIPKVVQTDEILMSKKSLSSPRKLKPYEVDLTKTKIKGLNIPLLPLKSETSLFGVTPVHTKNSSSTILSPMYYKEKLPTLGDSPKYSNHYLSHKFTDDDYGSKMSSPRDPSIKWNMPTMTESLSPRGHGGFKLNPLSAHRSSEPTIHKKTDLAINSYNVADYELGAPFTSRRGALALAINSMKTTDMVYGMGQIFQRAEKALITSEELNPVQVTANYMKPKGDVGHKINPMFPSQHNMFRVKPNRAHIIVDFYKGEKSPRTNRTKK